MSTPGPHGFRVLDGCVWAGPAQFKRIRAPGLFLRGSTSSAPLLKQPVVQRGNIKAEEADQRDRSATQTHFLRMSCFFCSSDVGRPMDFCLWSYIIFSTIPRVSPSRSDSCSGGGGGTNEEAAGRDCARSEGLKLYLGVLGADLLGVDFWIRGDHLAPPLHLVDLRVKSSFSSSFGAVAGFIARCFLLSPSGP